MEIEEYFQDKEVDNAKKMIKEFHGRILLDTSIKDPSAFLLSMYMASNKDKKAFVNKKGVKQIFLLLGRRSENFDKVFYEVSGKRKGKKRFIDIKGEEISLNFDGLKEVELIINKDNKKNE